MIGRGGLGMAGGPNPSETALTEIYELPAVTDPETALDPKTQVIQPALGDNLCFERKLDAGDVDFLQLLDPAENVVELRLQRRDLLVGDRDAGQLGDMAHGGSID